jgi:hypothetical protein
MKEFLVVLDDPKAAQRITKELNDVSISQRASNRLLVVSAPEDQARLVERIDGVQAVVEEDLPEALLEALTPAEGLFARSWHLRRAEGPKDRPHEGASWGDPRFEAPDAPHRARGR